MGGCKISNAIERKPKLQVPPNAQACTTNHNNSGIKKIDRIWSLSQIGPANSLEHCQEVDNTFSDDEEAKPYCRRRTGSLNTQQEVRCYRLQKTTQRMIFCGLA